MAITTYAELQAFVTAHLELDADTEAQLPNLIQLAECELGRMILDPRREVVATATTTAAVQTVALPEDFIQARSVLIDDDYTLSAVNLNVLQGFCADSASGRPQVYAVTNQSLAFGPIPDAVYTLTLTYLASLTALSNSATSNWLLETSPDAYVFAVLLQTEAYLHNDERLPLLQSKLDAVISQINRQGNRYRNAGPARLRSPVVV